MAEHSTQEPMSTDLGSLNVPTSCGKDEHCFHAMKNEAGPSAIVLSEEQANIFAKVKKGDSVFITGPAGTGKTVLLPSTGIASINIGGTTLHSWAGIGLGKESAKDLSGRILGTKDLRKRWWFVRSLIIDESKFFFHCELTLCQAKD
ncbi:hypothetical protein EI94DRAFT_105939 [Lactarius quietus]|nr:hypothetical protein EI94DRAFT_105939 [Lactarius quietus]